MTATLGEPPLPKQADKTVILLARELYEATPDTMVPEWSMPDLLSQVKEVTGTTLNRKTIQRWAAEGGWKRAPGKAASRPAILKEAIARSVGIPLESEEEPKAKPEKPPKEPKPARPEKAKKQQAKPKDTRPANKTLPRPADEAEQPEIITVAQQQERKRKQKVEKLAKLPTRAELVRDAMIDRLADYIKGGRAVSMGAISALADQLKRDREARLKLSNELRGKDLMDPDVREAMAWLIEPRDMVAIAKLGTIFNAPQLTLVFDSDKNQQEDSAQVMSWEGGFVGPAPHMPELPSGESEDK